VNKLSF